ncbi:MAG: molybdate ABC transporter substrate-binding protein [Pseudomonadota bacterium]
MNKRRLLLWWCLLLAGSQVASAVYASEPPVRIAAASSMRFVLDALISAHRDNGAAATIQPVYGSSGNLYRQIVQGAPFDLFLSADHALVEKLAATGVVDRSLLFGHGRLMLYSGENIAADQLIEQFTTAIKRGLLQDKSFQIAIANPAHAPYGKAARQALQSMGLWQAGQPYMVVADNVSQAAQFAQTGAVAFALVADALTTQLPGQATAIDQQHYSPVQLTLGVINHNAGADSFVDFIALPQAQQIIDQYGLLATKVTE